MQQRTWTVTSFPDAWTGIAQGPSVVNGVIMANTSDSPLTVSIRLSNGFDEPRAVIVPALTLEVGESRVLDVNYLAVGVLDWLQASVTGPGLHMIMNGLVPLVPGVD